MSTAAATREAVREQPFLRHALQAGVLNYTAAASFLAVGETEAVATALRRFGAELPPFETHTADARVRMQSGVGLVDGDGTVENALLSVGTVAVVPDSGAFTAVLATGAVDVSALGTVCSRLAAEDIDAEAAAVAGETLLAVVDQRDGVSALRAIEDALECVPA